MKKLLKRTLQKIFRELGYAIVPVQLASSSNDRMLQCLQNLRQRGMKGHQTILDVGANSTTWSLKAKQIFSDARFFLVEPQIEMKPALESFCKSNPGSQYFLAGAGAQEKTLVLTVWEDLQGSSLLVNPYAKDTKGLRQQREVPILTIDSLIRTGQMPMPNIIKLDVQGFELEALKGAMLTFGNTEAYILEVSLFEFLPNTPSFAEVIRFMEERGYVVYDFPGSINRPYDGALGQIDLCFVRANGALRKSHQW